MTEEISKRTELKLLFLIITTFIAACIETDIYLRAFPDMMMWFSASEKEIQHLLTWNFVGICLAGPIYGPLSDACGRKKPLVIALGIFLAGSLLTLVASNLDHMLLGRILQGLGSGGCFTLGTAIVFDAFQKERAIQAINKLNTIIPPLIAAAPLLGGYLSQAFGFRSNFLAIAACVAFSLLICQFFFQETLPQDKRTPLHVSSLFRVFKQVFSNLAFWQLTLVISLLFAGYITFLSGTSILFVVELGMSKTLFPLMQALILGGWVAGSLLLNRTIAKWGVPRVKQMGIGLCILGGVILGIVLVVAPRDPYLQTVGMIFYTLGANWLVGLYFTEGMEILPHIKGVTASLLTSTRFLVAAMVVGMASKLYNGTIYPIAGTVLGIIACILLILICYEKRRSLAVVKTSHNAPHLH